MILAYDNHGIGIIGPKNFIGRNYLEAVCHKDKIWDYGWASLHDKELIFNGGSRDFRSIVFVSVELGKDNVTEQWYKLGEWQQL